MENRSSEFGTIPRYGMYASNLTIFYTIAFQTDIPTYLKFIRSIFEFVFAPFSHFQLIDLSLHLLILKLHGIDGENLIKLRIKLLRLLEEFLTSYIFNAQLYGVVREDRTILVARLSKKTEKLYRTYTLFPIIIRRITH